LNGIRQIIPELFTRKNRLQKSSTKIVYEHISHPVNAANTQKRYWKAANITMFNKQSTKDNMALHHKRQPRLLAHPNYTNKLHDNPIFIYAALLFNLCSLLASLFSSKIFSKCTMTVWLFVESQPRHH
jgi:hypothetical protein